MANIPGKLGIQKLVMNFFILRDKYLLTKI